MTPTQSLGPQAVLLNDGRGSDGLPGGGIDGIGEWESMRPWSVASLAVIALARHASNHVTAAGSLGVGYQTNREDRPSKLCILLFK